MTIQYKVSFIQKPDTIQAFLKIVDLLRKSLELSQLLFDLNPVRVKF